MPAKQPFPNKTTERQPSPLIERLRQSAPQSVERVMVATTKTGEAILGHTGHTYHFTSQSFGRTLEYATLLNSVDAGDSMFALVVLTCDEFRAEPDREAMMEAIKNLDTNAGTELLAICNAINGWGSTRKTEPEEVSKQEEAEFRGPKVV